VNEHCADDGNICNGDEYCNQETNLCDHRSPLSDGTRCGTFPRRICISRTCQESICGDEYIDTENGEECDDGNGINDDGCDNDCAYSCHDSSECDDGQGCTSGICNTDDHTCDYLLVVAGVSCRPADEFCDVEEVCDGSSPECPPDAFEPSGTLCRPAAGPCDVDDFCTGTSAECPADSFAAPGTECDDGDYCTTHDQCDAAGNCAGTESDRLYGVTDICSGAYHNCALLATGGVKCWGLNNHGQLGDGTLMNKLAPVDVSGLSEGVQAITCGAYHTCALLSPDSLKCWGYNASGQLGDGTNDDKPAPVLVPGIPSGITRVSAGGYHTCALSSSGRVRCWGQNSYGQIGDGTTTVRLLPTSVVSINDASTVSAGGYHTCALEDNRGYCWGYNAYGQIGDGTTINRSRPEEVELIGMTIPSTFSLGRYHTCMLYAAGRLDCWGFNDDGQIGDGTTDNSDLPVNVTGLSSGVAGSSLGHYHSCAWLTSGPAKCWGKNNNGQLGDGTTDNRLTPVNVIGLASEVAAMDMGFYHTCALCDTGEVQ